MKQCFYTVNSNLLRTLAEDLGHGMSNLHNTINAIIEKCAFISCVSKYNVHGDALKPIISENLLLNVRELIIVP